MKTENNYSLMVWIIVVLAVLNISTFTTIIYHQYRSGQSTAISDSDPKQPEADSKKFSGRYFRDKLNLSSDQMDKFRVINLAFRPKTRDITIALESKRKQMFIEMSAQNSDTSRLNLLSDSIGLLHSNLKKLTYRYYIDIKEICDQEQQIKLEQIFQEIFSSDSLMGHPGIGGPGGRQHGKQFKN